MIIPHPVTSPPFVCGLETYDIAFATAGQFRQDQSRQVANALPVVSHVSPSVRHEHHVTNGVSCDEKAITKWKN